MEYSNVSPVSSGFDDSIISIPQLMTDGALRPSASLPHDMINTHLSLQQSKHQTRSSFSKAPDDSESIAYSSRYILFVRHALLRPLIGFLVLPFIYPQFSFSILLSPCPIYMNNYSYFNTFIIICQVFEVFLKIFFLLANFNPKKLRVKSGGKAGLNSKRETNFKSLR